MRCAVAVAAIVAVVCGCAMGSSDPGDSVAAARADLRRYIEDVTQATASRYQLVDDRGHEMDTLKVLAIPESGGFVGLYHSYRSGTFFVHLATSTDLLHWTWRAQLADHASMPTIKPASDGGYVVAWEQEPLNHLKFAYYEDWPALLEATPSETFDAPWQLSRCAEGTPNLYRASSTDIEVGFHFFRDCDLDREALGTTDWKSWTSAPRPELDHALETQGVAGGIGDRDVVAFEGFDLTLVEGMMVRDDWSTWRTFLYDEATGAAEAVDFRTAAGSIAFTNPTIADIVINGQRAVLVTLFLPQEGAGPGEAGELIYFKVYEP